MVEAPRVRVVAFNCPNCGAAAAPDSVNCPYCKSTIATRVCPSCFGAVSFGMGHCPSCGAEAGSGAPEKETQLKCPRCEKEMSIVPAGKHKLHECLQCGGLWVRRADFQEICTQQEDQEAVLGIEAGNGEPSILSTPSRSRVYVPCPECGKLMNRKNFAGCSGVVLDWCREHGSWFDRSELRQIVEFIRTGGLRKSREREISRLQEEKLQLREQQRIMSTLANRTGAVSGGNLEFPQEQDPFLQVLSFLFRDMGR